MRTRMNLIRVVGIGALLVATGMAHALELDPGDLIAGTGYGPSNCEPTCVETVFSMTDLILLYKAEVPREPAKGESASPILEFGAFADFYTTVFANSAFDPEDATVSWDGGAAIDCPVCYLAVKGGRPGPGYYFYDLAKWDGTESIELTGLWPTQGAISHVSIWGKSVSVPEPSALALLGSALLLIGLRRRRRTD